MEKWSKPSRDHRKQHQRENPSFSSTLLDVIYRSIDDGNRTEEKQSNSYIEESVEAEKLSSRRARKVENWMEKKGSENVVRRRNSLTEFESRTRSNSNSNSSSNTLFMHSSSSSSESSSAGGFSSSESEYFYGVQRPKSIRTSVSEKSTNLDYGYNRNHFVQQLQSQKPKNENGLGKSKSKALGILYGDLKKSKQPISPGARLSSFLNSLFTNTKKPKVSTTTKKTTTTTTTITKPSSAQASTCSSVSSFSRSCLSKTPSSRSGGAKRSVRFCPVSVIVDEDCRPCGHKNLHEEGLQKSYGKNSSEELRLHVMQESRRVEELARNLLKNYQKKNEVDFNMQFEDEEDDDAASCSSSDLFELDNLSAIGIERYREELPVYETTHFNPNRVIGNGFIL